MARNPALAVHKDRVRPTIQIAGQRTSISLDPVVWAAFCEIAAHLGKEPTQLVAEIHRSRGAMGAKGLSVAIRRYVVEFYRSRLKLPPH
jgi:predicted DNA-binding ribbon-helix-helix protein